MKVEDYNIVPEEFRNLVIANPFGDRMAFLLRNQNIGTRFKKNLKGEVRQSNCIGTACWTTRLLERLLPIHLYDVDFRELLKNQRDVALMVLKDFKDPNEFYLRDPEHLEASLVERTDTWGRDPIREELIRNGGFIGEKIPGAIVIRANYDRNGVDHHFGVYL